MKTIYRITFLSFILPLILPFLFFVFSLILSYGLIITSNIGVILPICVSVLILLSFVLTFILHYNYYRVDKNKILEIDLNMQEISITQNSKTHLFKLLDVDRVRMTHSSNYDNSYRKTMPWGSYYFYMICLKNDEEFIVTRLVVRKLETILNVRIVYKRVFFPIITKDYLRRANNA